MTDETTSCTEEEDEINEQNSSTNEGLVFLGLAMRSANRVCQIMHLHRIAQGGNV